ncbi:MAG: BTAD domain-containing putative transcriptional regulator [Armatimonadota bacterium]|nr:BTAD domain-containing putative transcriptional regulator [Armatimonadota bacterium]MDR7444364.1 BTAD domain-containing putative transcriptional regulator [Armatimonadota bacterium]MDR7569645.1 BTAD domain-containing putative transcriptional regulator [Armatimonadota bacterium]MDR7614851.1 BTAD domain-containing putative transcriptional regulator [Armatimonadota bacterium]
MPGGVWLVRTRLLDRLPREPRYVVWLQAPYGFGKTVLLRQWADQLREKGWRVVWASGAAGSLSEQIARSLGADPTARWGLLRVLLEDRPTLLVLDDVALDATLDLRLPADGLLVGLSSRAELSWPELPRMHTQGRLVRLTAEELRFTLAEVRELIADDRRAYEVWESSGGWPIAVHMAALTGTLDLHRALVQGVRESLGSQEWETLLLLSALPTLPDSAEDRGLRRLEESGFVQRTPEGFRIHALFAEVLHATALAEIQEAVRRRASQLSPELRAEAYFRSGLWQELERLLDSPEALDLAGISPSGLLRWCRALPGLGGPWRRLAYGMTLCLQGKLQEAFARLEALARDVEATHPEVAIRAWGLVAYNAPEVDLQRALNAVERGWRLVDRVEPHAAARFLNWAVWPLWKAGHLDRFEAALQEASRRLPPDDPYLFHPIGYNLAFLRWQKEGNLEHYLAWNRRTAEHQERTRSHNLPLTLLETGRLLVLAGRSEEALACFRRAQAHPGWNFWAEALAAAWAAYLERDTRPFERLASLAEADENPELLDAIRGLWARTLRESGSPDLALAVTQPVRGFWTALEAALTLWELGRPEEAQVYLPPEPRDREERAYYHAARYRILRSEVDLEALVRLTSLGPRILPALLPVHELPRHRPELADFYPIEEVLRCGWKEAIERRLDEIPLLAVELLGRFRVRRLGQEVLLSPTARNLLVLLLLGRDREAIAEDLWPEAAPGQARNNLHVHLHHLRRALEPWGVPTYLTPTGFRRTRVDLWDLQEALDRQDAEAVLRLYREPVAPGVDLPAVDEVRYALQQRVVDLLHRRGSASESEEGIRYLERVLELDPLHEPALQALLRCLLSLGRREAALRAYRAFAERLRAELDTDPLPETQALLDSVPTGTSSRRRRS